MRDRRAHEEAVRLIDRARGVFPLDVRLHTLQAQSLVDLRLPHAARDVLGAVQPDPTDAYAWSEHQGLVGRVNKQAFIDAPSRSSPAAREALRAALAAYGRVFATDPTRYWHGINLAALLAQPEAEGDAAAVATQVMAVLDAVPEGTQRDGWWYATRAEAFFALGQEAEFTAALQQMLQPPAAPDGTLVPLTHFALHALTRQLCELWQLDSPRGPLGGRGVALIGVLRGAYLQTAGYETAVSLPASAVANATVASAEDLDGFEVAFGAGGMKTLRWWELGVRRARSVAAIQIPRDAGGWRRWGSGFLVAVRSPGGGPAELCVLTNSHVIGDASEGGKTDLTRTKLCFEGGATPTRDHQISEVIWMSPARELDAALLRIHPPVTDLDPLPLTAAIPHRGTSDVQLFIVGHPAGDELTFSFQDNLLLDHDGPLTGVPRRPGTWLLHYRTPTIKGSSGSPVFIGEGWRTVALHHAGKDTMRRLNGQAGTYEANEGIALVSIAAALAAEKGLDLMLDAAAPVGGPS